MMPELPRTTCTSCPPTNPRPIWGNITVCGDCQQNSPPDPEEQETL